MTKASDNVFPKLIESLNTSDPAAPSDSSWKVYAKANGIFARSSNSVVGPFGTGGGGTTVATDAIWDAAGDLAVGSGADTAAKLSIGATNGMVVERVSGAVAWALPPGYEFSYVEFTSNVGPTATTEGTANTVVTSGAVTYDGSTAVVISFFSPDAEPSNGANNNLKFWLYDGSSSIGRIGAIFQSAVGGDDVVPVYLERRLTPSNASHTYSIRASVNGGTGSVDAGAGGTGNVMPGFIRIVKV